MKRGKATNKKDGPAASKSADTDDEIIIIESSTAVKRAKFDGHGSTKTLREVNSGRSATVQTSLTSFFKSSGSGDTGSVGARQSSTVQTSLKSYFASNRSISTGVLKEAQQAKKSSRSTKEKLTTSTERLPSVQPTSSTRDPIRCLPIEEVKLEDTASPGVEYPPDPFDVEADALNSSDDEIFASLDIDTIISKETKTTFNQQYQTSVSTSTVLRRSVSTPTDSASTDRGTNQRKCPFYKLLPGTAFAVDAFNFGTIPNVVAYLLSHFHSDHYIGLTKKFSQPIYCSRITANLVKRQLGVNAKYVHELPMNSSVEMNGMEVTLLDANHCPGSVLFLIKLPDGRVYLHTGDFRADPKVVGENPFIQRLREISKLTVWLDTTYLDPNYNFDSQDATVDFAAELAMKAVRSNPKTLICCGTYSVGKEKIFMRIAQAIGSKVAVTDQKLKLLQCFEWKEFDEMLTKEWHLAQVHVLPMYAVKSFESLEEHLKKFRNYTALLSIVPSGWQFSRKRTSLYDIKPKVRGNISVIGLPYSEHSSFDELRQFCQQLKPKDVIPTVNVGNPTRRKAMQNIISSWLSGESEKEPQKTAQQQKRQNSITNFFTSSSSL